MSALDRDQARDVLREWIDSPMEDELLDRLAACVRPATIDRDALRAVVLWTASKAPLTGVIDEATDRIIALVEAAS